MQTFSAYLTRRIKVPAITIAGVLLLFDPGIALSVNSVVVSVRQATR